MILHLDGATFIDFTFLGALLGGMKRLRERGGEIGVVCPDRDLIALTLGDLGELAMHVESD